MDDQTRTTMKTVRTSLLAWLALSLLAAPAMAQEEHHVRIEMEHSVNGNTRKVIKEFTAPSEAALQDSLQALVDLDAPTGGALLGVSLASMPASGKAEEGAHVVHVSPGTPAATADLQEGDIITAMGGKAITGPEGVTGVVGAHQPGDRMPLTYTRNGKSTTVEVTLAERPEVHSFGDLELLEDSDIMGAWNLPWRLETKPRAFLGIRPGESQENGGAVVGAVEPGSAAARMGIEKGDRITRLNDKDVADFADLAQQVAAQAPGDSISVTVMRDGKKHQLNGTLGERDDDLAWGGAMPSMRSFNLQGVGPDLQKQIDQLQEQMEQFRKQLEDLKADPGQ